MSDPTFTEDHTAIVPASDQGSDYADPGYSDTTTHDDSYDSGYGSGGSGDHQVVDSNNNGVDDTVIVELAPGVQGAIVDVNEDGTPDVVLIDLDGNGSYDAAIQADGKGGFVVSVDTDGDGRPDDSRTLTRAELDSAIPGLADVLDPSGTGGHNGTVSDTDSSGGDGRPVVYDTDNNGIDDTVVVELAPGVQGLIVDVNEDGTPDVVMIDLDGNGKIDTMIKADGKGDFVIGYDDDEDGQVDRQEPITREQLDSAVPGLADVLDPSTGGGHNSTVSDGAVGAPSEPQELDTNKNGVTDAVAFQIAPGIQAVAVDPDEDGRFDAVLIDMSGDGTLDTMVAPDGHGGFVIGYDDDGDGRIDRQETATRAQLDQAVPGLADALDPRGGSGSGGSDGGGRNV
ncbi:MAG: hypothetical protein EKK42_25165 [Pseudonocardiaceae bacterium]|nr:MAG: hypothetical protein EKK42_25165 [Pseudonocardiaceae bacterium]